MGIAGHCVRHPEEATHHTILWEQTHGKSRRGAPCMNYVTLLKKDTGLDNTHEIETVITPIARAVLDSRAVREGPYVNGKPRATGRATKFQTK